MSRSTFLPSQTINTGWLTTSAEFSNPRTKRHYKVFSRGTKVFETESELDPSGREIFNHTEELAYIVGTGANGATPLVRRDKYLFQAPISYYTARKTWDLSPNYESHDLGFTLPVSAECIDCHAGRTQPVKGRVGLFNDPPIIELGISCERCHGPGELHVKERTAGVPVAGNHDDSIVNPAKLPTWLADNICMNCHEGDNRTLQPGKSAADFRPGTPLNETAAIVKTPIDLHAPQTPLLEHYYSMTLSKCYRKSAGKLGCQSCHDPHVQPTAAEAPKYFRTRCLQCHTEKSCTLELHQRLAQQPQDACTACHMAKKPALTVSHSTLTEHRILRAPDEPYPSTAFVESLPGTGFIDVNAVPDSPDSLPQITLLKAYRKELMRGTLSIKDRYFATLDRLEKAGSKDPFVLSAIAQRADGDGNLPKAIRFARQVIEGDAASDPDYLLLADLLARSGDVAGSIGVLKKGIAVSPYGAVLYEQLALRQLSAQNLEEARATAQRGLELFAESSALRDVVKQLSSEDHVQQAMRRFQQGDAQGAAAELQAAISANPKNARAHDAMGIVLGESGRLDEARAEFQAAADIDPAFPEPHFHLGLAFLRNGKTPDAINEYQEALRLNPGLVEARYGLAEICGEIGDIDGAIKLLQQVTQAEPDFAEARYNLGLNLWTRYRKSESLRKQSDLEQSVQELSKALQLAPAQSKVYFALGQVQSEKGDLAQAAENLQRAAEMEPGNPEYHYNLGLALRQKGDLQSAANQFRAALQLSPQLALAHRALGRALRESGDLEGAANELRQAVAQAPEDSQGHHLLGTVLLKQNDLENAISELQKAVELDPSMGDARASLAQALQKAGRKEESQQQSEALRRSGAIASKVGQAMVLLQAAAEKSDKQDYAGAASSLGEAIALDPTFTEAQFQLAVALRKSGDVTKAKDVLRQLLLHNPRHAPAHLQLGLMLAEGTEEAEAANQLRTALEIAPSLGEAHLGLARLAKAAQNWPDAILEYQLALAWAPQNHQMHLELADVFKASGRLAESAREKEILQKLTAPESPQ
jgi:tetratricopeptide (TPR) repeat protein